MWFTGQNRGKRDREGRSSSGGLYGGTWLLLQAPSPMMAQYLLVLLRHSNTSLAKAAHSQVGCQMGTSCSSTQATRLATPSPHMPHPSPPPTHLVAPCPTPGAARPSLTVCHACRPRSTGRRVAEPSLSERLAVFLLLAQTLSKAAKIPEATKVQSQCASLFATPQHQHIQATDIRCAIKGIYWWSDCCS